MSKPGGWTEGQAARVVEHDDASRKPKTGGQVIPVTVRGVATYVHVDLPDGTRAYFWADSGWRAWDGEFRWRLMQPEEDKMKQNDTYGEITDEEHQALRDAANPCTECGMLATVDPVMHEGRYGHAPRYRDPEGVLLTWAGAGWLALPEMS